MIMRVKESESQFQFRGWFCTLLMLNGLLSWLAGGLSLLLEPAPLPMIGLLVLAAIPVLGVKKRKKRPAPQGERDRR